MQIDKLFTSIWYNTTTWPWTPLTGLSATITIRDKNTNSIVVNNQAMTEIGLWEYDYTFTTMDWTKAYSYVMNPNSTLAYVTTWFVDPRMANIDGAITDIRVGGWVNLSGVTGSINELKRKIEEEEANTRWLIDSHYNDTNSHIDIVKNDIVDTINSIEQNETDISGIVEWIGILKARFTNLQKWLKEEQKKEMECKDMENEGKISELQQKIDDMEEAFQEMEWLKWSELEEKQKLIDDMELTAQEIIDQLEKEKVVNKDTTEKEIKDKLISSLSE